jgi:myo-inositol-1(or 4)-monophosphatase
VQRPLSFAIELARQTGDLLLKYYHSNNLATDLKADGSVITEADIAADNLITATIQNRFPENRLISEEHQSILSPNDLEPSRDVWIVDPLDGTTNFSLGLPIWGVILSLLIGGWPEIAVLYFPVIDELFSAQHGKGAFRNGELLEIKSPNSKRPLSFFSCCSRTHQDYQVSIPYKTRIFGSAGYSICAVAKSIAIVAFEATPKIWDIAAGWLLVNEAGGAINTLDNSQPFPLKPGFDYSSKNFPTMAAANQGVMSRSLKQIIPKNRNLIEAVHYN